MHGVRLEEEQEIVVRPVKWSKAHKVEMLVEDDRAHDAETTPDEVLRIRDEI